MDGFRKFVGADDGLYEGKPLIAGLAVFRVVDFEIMRHRRIGLQEEVGTFFGDERQHIAVARLHRLHFQRYRVGGCFVPSFDDRQRKRTHVNIGREGADVPVAGMGLYDLLPGVVEPKARIAELIVVKTAFYQLVPGFVVFGGAFSGIKKCIRPAGIYKKPQSFVDVVEVDFL